MNIDFSVIIPTYRDWKRLQICVDALTKQSFPQEKFEVIIINNDPKDPVPTGFNLPSNFRILVEGKSGSYAARNTGIEGAGGRFLAFTDSDCVPDRFWLQNAYSTFELENPGLIGGKVEVFRAVGGSRLVYRYERLASFRQEINVPKGHGVTANLIVNRAIVDNVGLFNSNMNSGGDWEFTGRCIQQGYIMVFRADVVVNHPARTSLKQLLAKDRRIASWGIVNAQKSSGNSKMFIILQQFKNSCFKLYNQQKRGESLIDRFSVLLVGGIRIVYKLYIGLLVATNIINVNRIR